MQRKVGDENGSKEKEESYKEEKDLKEEEIKSFKRMPPTQSVFTECGLSFFRFYGLIYELQK